MCKYLFDSTDHVFVLFRLLVQAGCDIQSKDDDGWTPLHAAAHWGMKEACEILAENGANFGERNNLV